MLATVTIADRPSVRQVSSGMAKNKKRSKAGAKKKKPSLATLPPEIQERIVSFVRLHPDDPRHSKRDLGSLRLVNKRFAELGEPLLFETNIDHLLFEDEIHRQGPQSWYPEKLVKHLEVAMISVALPGNMKGTRTSASQIDRFDALVALVLERCNKLKQAMVSCRTAPHPTLGTFRTLPIVHAVLCQTQSLQILQIYDIDGAAGLRLASSIVSGVHSLLSVDIRWHPEYMEKSVPGSMDLATRLACSNFTTSILGACHLEDLALEGPCLVDPKCLLPARNTGLLSLDVSHQASSWAIASLMARSKCNLRTARVPASALAALAGLDREKKALWCCEGQDKKGYQSLTELHIVCPGSAKHINLTAISEGPNKLSSLSISAARDVPAVLVAAIASGSFSQLGMVTVRQDHFDDLSAALRHVCGQKRILLGEGYLVRDDEEEIANQVEQLTLVTGAGSEAQ